MVNASEPGPPCAAGSFEKLAVSASGSNAGALAATVNDTVSVPSAAPPPSASA